VAVNGTNVTLAIQGVNWFTYTFDPRLDEDGLPIPLNKGYVGVAMDGGSGKVDNFTVQVLPPEITLEIVDDFTGPTAAEIYTPATGTWTLAGGQYSGTAPAGQTAVSLAYLGASISVSSILEFEAEVAPGGVGGVAFDYYGPNDFKFVVIDAANDQILVGHVDLKTGLSIDETYVKSLDDLSSHRVKLSISGAAVNISIDNSFLDTHGFNAALVDGDFGLVSLEGTTGFDEIAIRTNDRAFEVADALRAVSVPTEALSTQALTQADVDGMVETAIAALVEKHGLTAEQEAKLRAVKVTVADLDGMILGRSEDDRITIDPDAAGHGWFVDLTPLTNEEYEADASGMLRALPGGAAVGRIDLLSVLTHELDHTLGHTHLAWADADDLQTDLLEPGTRLAVFADDAAPATASSEASAPRSRVPTWVFDDTFGTFVSADQARHMVSARSLGLALGRDDSLFSFDNDDDDEDTEIREIGSIFEDEPDVETVTESDETAAESSETADAPEGIIAWNQHNGLLGRLAGLFRVQDH